MNIAARCKQPLWPAVDTDVRRLGPTVALGCLLLAVAACGGSTSEVAAPTRAAGPGPGALARAVTPQRLSAHLRAFASIAARNGGNRGTGARGYDQSVAYVARQLRRAGYRPRLHTFRFDLFRETRPPVVERVGAGAETYRHGHDFLTLRYSGGGTVTGPVFVVAPASGGCGRSDFAQFPAGAIALVRRGICFLSQKARNAKAAGAKGVLIANDGAPGRVAPIAATLGRPGIGIPVLMISSTLGSRLEQSAQSGGVRLRISVSVVNRPARAANVIADVPGRRAGVVLLGAHLDSVANGPGINDNGSGSAVVLEIARQARRLGLRPARGLRFAFWGAEELGLVGSTAYVESRTAVQLSQIRAVLNFDMVASKNFGRFVYDGDSASTGSPRIEQLFRAHFSARRQPVDEIPLRGSSDHAPFADAGIPVGGLFTGADDRKSSEAAQRFGGAGGEPYDACYHKACDSLANVNLGVLSQMADAAAVVAVRLAS